MKLNFISADTKDVLEIISKHKFINKFILVGGTALSIQLGHRLSEDLDFIYDGEFLDSDSIKKFVDKNFKGRYKLIKQDDEHQLDFIINDVKVTFFTSGSVLIPFKVIDYSEKFGNVNVASVEIISILKLNALAQRNTIRDYYDLYYIAKNVIPLEKIFIKSRELLTHLSDITYSETITYVDDLKENSISGHLEPKEKVSKIEIAEYFTKEIKKIIKNK